MQQVTIDIWFHSLFLAISVHSLNYTNHDSGSESISTINVYKQSVEPIREEEEECLSETAKQSNSRDTRTTLFDTVSFCFCIISTRMHKECDATRHFPSTRFADSSSVKNIWKYFVIIEKIQFLKD